MRLVRLVYDFGMSGAFFRLLVRLVRLVKDFGASIALLNCWCFF